MKALKFFLKTLSGVKREKGFTLTEMTAVLAVTATLTALAIPVVADKVEQAKITRAALDIQGINQALAAFFQSLGEWPSRNATGDRNAIKILRVGTGGRGANPATTGSSNWNLTDADDDAANHLIKDDSNRYRGKEPTKPWNGPYIGDIRGDPWERNYVINIRGFWERPDIKATTTTATSFGWILSAGPNGKIETDINNFTINIAPEDPAIGGDDIGVMAFKAKEIE